MTLKSTIHRLSRFVPIFFLFAFYSSNLFAGNGKISGRVFDADTQEPLISANVIVTHSILSNGVRVPVDPPLGAATDIEGYYFILNVQPGLYVVRASMIGYNAVSQELVKVDPDRTIQVNFELAPSSIEMEELVVTAERELIKPDVSATQEVIVTQRIEQMPVLRVDEFVGKIKGIELVSGEQGNGLSVRGGDIRETAIKMDGISLQDPRSETSYMSFNTTTIKEIQILTGGFEAKYGGIRSGLLNVISKEGSRDRYTVSLKFDYAPADQKRFFGQSPWGDDSWIYRVYAGEYAMSGVAEGDTLVPVELRDFKGWAHRSTPERALDSLQKLELWKAQHPQYTFGDKPDIYFEGSITGPVPGSFIPIWGDFADRTTFLLGFKYEDSQLAFPIGPRDNYVDWNTQLKLTTQIQRDMRLSVNGLYSKIETASGGRTTNYGGALVDIASSFSFLNSSESSVEQQARLISGNSFDQIFNKSRLQYYDQKYFVGGAKFTHTLSNSAFYTVDFQVGYTDQSLKPFSYDPGDSSKYISFYSEAAKRTYTYYLPQYGSPDASTNYGDDVLGVFRVFGGPQRIDSSYSYVYQLNGDLTMQIGRHHQVEAGFSARLQNLFVYTGTWLQSQKSFTPDTWQYYRETPLEIGLYVQDKLEFEGMVLNLGLRADYFNPMKEGFKVGFPQDDSYRELFNEIYQNLSGESQSYDRWLEFRELLENPPGWPRAENKVQVKLSPRLGVSFPITESSKLYFNYGHFYQRPPTLMLYNTSVSVSSVAIPTPDLQMARTVSYEFGYEQLFFDDFIVNVTAYYKDISNEPLARTYINYYQDNIVTKYVPDKYRDIRGVELRLERPLGRFVSFNAMYDYRLESVGQTGLAVVYEDRILARDSEIRSAALYNTEPRPRANVNLNLHTPIDFGPELFGVHWLGEFYANFLFEWQDGGRILLNPEETQVRLQNWVDRVNYWNIDFRGSKAITTDFGSIEFVITIKNLTNNKWLITENMSTSQLSTYKNSLRTPDKGGNDKWGEYKSSDGHIDIGWWTAPLFLNPRRIILGVRVNF